MGRILERPRFAIGEGQVITVSGQVKIPLLLDFIKANPDIFSDPESHIKTVENGLKTQQLLLEYGGVFLRRSQQVIINYNKTENIPQNGFTIPPNFRKTLGYRFSRPNKNGLIHPVFFTVQNGKHLLVEREYEHIKSVMGDLYAQNQLPKPRFSSTSLTDLNLMVASDTYGLGLLKPR